MIDSQSPAACPADPTPERLDDDGLQARLLDADAAVRRIAVLELAEEGEETGLPWLQRLLAHDPDVEVRRESAAGLAAREDQASVVALAGALDDREEVVRHAAATSLAELQDPAAAPWLLSALADTTTPTAGRPHDGFRRAALLRALRGLRAADALGPARQLLGDSDPEVRREAIGVIGWLQATIALPDLAGLAARDADAAVRRAATGALGLAADAALVLDTLQAALADPDWTVREEAATTLGKLGADEAVEALRTALADRFWQVRLASVRSLGRLGRASGAAVPEVIAQLEQPSPNLRKEAVIALGQIGDARVAPVLERAAGDPDPDVRKLARLALSTLARSTESLG